MSYIPRYDVEEILDIYEDIIVGLLMDGHSMEIFFNHETKTFTCEGRAMQSFLSCFLNNKL